MQEAFPALKNPKICTDVACYAAKVASENENQLEAARKAGRTVLNGDHARKLFDDYGERSSLCYLSGYIDLAINPARKAGSWAEVIGTNRASVFSPIKGFRPEKLI